MEGDEWGGELGGREGRSVKVCFFSRHLLSPSL